MKITTSIIATLLTCWLATGQQIVTEQGSTYLLHTIAKGEGLYRISVTYGLSQQELIDANPSLKTTGPIVGAVLRIPYRNASAQSIKKPNSTTTYITHVVEKGQTAYSISKRYQIPLATFYAVNPGCEAGVTAGMSVKIPVAQNVSKSMFRMHIIASGETLYSIGVRYGVKAEEIIAANQALDVNALPIGTPIRIPDSVLPTEDDAFIYHRIANGETLFALCNMYDMLKENIIKYNTTVDWNALAVGQIIAIPKKNIPAPKIIEHNVGKRETLYGISRQYEVDINDIRSENPTIDFDNLKKGDIVKIPSGVKINMTPANYRPEFVGDGNSTIVNNGEYDYNVDHPFINVGLMLPFNANKELAQMNDDSDTYISGASSNRYIEFYQGVLLAIDSLKRQNTRIRLSVYDTHDPSFNMFRLLNLPEVAQLDLIIGPAHLDNMRKVADFAVTNKIPSVFPFATMDSTLLDNHYLYQASRIDSMSHIDAANAIAADAVGKHLILLTTGSKHRFEQQRFDAISRVCKAKGIELTEHKFVLADAAAFVQKLSVTNENLVVLPSNDEARVNSILVAIAGSIDQFEGKMSIVGMNDWLAFQTIEAGVLHRLNTVIYSSFGIDYDDETARSIMSKYRSWYFSEPVAFTPYFQKIHPNTGYSQFGLCGYDLTFYFISAIRKYGRDFDKHLPQLNVSLAQTNLKFKHVTNWGGSYNSGLRKLVFNSNNTISVSDI